MSPAPAAGALTDRTAAAMVWHGGTDFRLTEVPLPHPADGEVLVRLTMATICGSDRHTVSGRRQEACPSVLGHEGVGVVLASRRDGVRTGERVVFSVVDSCGECRRCRRGLSAKCEQVRKLGHEPFAGPWPLSGTYASHVLLRAGQAITAVPDTLDDAHASVAGCAVATVMAMRERAGALSGRRVLVSGAGMLGLIALAVAREAGASHVIASDPQPAARELAATLADEVVDPAGSAPAPDGVDVALELSGARAGVVTCLESLDVGGTAVLAGTVAPVPAVPFDPEQLVRGWRTVTGVHNYAPHHLAEAVDFLVASGSLLPWAQLLGPAVGLTELASAFAQPDGAPRTPVRL